MDISEAEYDQIQQEIKDHDIWSEFREWLVSERGVSKTTARTYATQARRIIRELDGDVTEQTLFDWVNCRPAVHRTPFRCSWRRYIDFMAAQYSTTLPNFPSGSSVPLDVAAALHAIKQKGIGSGAIAALTTTKDTGARFSALCGIDRGVAAGTLVVVLDLTDSLCLIPADAYATLLAWGKQHTRMDAPNEPRWLVPDAPGALRAMQPIRITRIAKTHKTV